MAMFAKNKLKINEIKTPKRMFARCTNEVYLIHYDNHRDFYDISQSHQV